MKRLYLIVEASGLEHILKICDNQEEVAKWLQVSQSAINQAIKKNEAIRYKYKIEVVNI